MTSTTEPRPQKQEKLDASAEVTEVAPGVLRMQLPISLPGLGHVNCYAIEDRDGLTVVDPGLPGATNWKALKARLKSTGNRVGDVRRVIVTHSHPDHFGGAGALRHEAGAEVITHTSFRTWFDPTEEESVDDDSDDSDDGDATGGSSAPFDQRTPWGGERFRPPLRRRLRWVLMRRFARRFIRPPTPSVRLADADRLELGGREWVALHTPGHTPDHLCLFDPDDGIVLSGDHVLPTITPHISGLVAGDDPLLEFFGSLDRMAELRGVRTVLPAHGHPFADLAGRAAAIKDHHEDRLDTLRRAAATLGAATVPELTRELFPERSWGPMADSETYAHLEHLRQAGEARSRWRDDHLIYELVTDEG